LLLDARDIGGKSLGDAPRDRVLKGENVLEPFVELLRPEQDAPISIGQTDRDAHAISRAPRSHAAAHIMHIMMHKFIPRWYYRLWYRASLGFSVHPRATPVERGTSGPGTKAKYGSPTATTGP
jgi:hypothetical protein